MKVIDILNKRANGEEIPKKIKIAGHIYVMNKFTNAIERIYVLEKYNDESWLNNEYLTLHTEVAVIEDKPEKEEIKPLPPLEYIKFNFEQSVDDVSSTITYMSTTATTDHDTNLLALVINRVIREVNDLKHNMEAMDKSMKE